MLADKLKDVLQQLNQSSTDIEASAVISSDGLMMASLLQQSMDEDRVGAMSAAMLSLGERTAQELARGNLEQVLIKGDKGYVLLTGVGSEGSVVTALVSPGAKLGLVFLDIKRAAEALGKLLS